MILKALVISLAAISLAGCASHQSASPATASQKHILESAEAMALPFIRNDYPGALAKAQSSGKPLFVDVNAPWCPTCRFMDAHVFTDPALRQDADRYVWLSLDTENPVNVAFVEKFPTDNWPSLMVIDPATEKPVLKWLGTAKRFPPSSEAAPSPTPHPLDLTARFPKRTAPNTQWT